MRFSIFDFFNRPSLKWGWAALFLLTFLSYLPSLDCGYIWDDDDYIENNPTLRSVEGLELIWWPFGKSRVFPITVQYYPLTYTSFWLESWIWEREPLGYHLTNIFLHALVSILLWRILDFLSVPGAWLVAAVFAVHPVHVESVSWVTERKNVLSGVFYLASMWMYLKFSFKKQSQKVYFFSLILFVAALLSKSVTCSLPAALLLILGWKKKSLSFKHWAPLIPFFVLGLGLGLLTAWMEKDVAGAMGPEWQLSFVERSLIAGRAICFYVGKLLWPTDLAFIYSRWQIDATVWWQYLFPMAVLTGIFIFWKNRLHWGRGPLVAVLFFIGTLFPALGFFNVYPMKFSFVADHFQYLASVGMLTLFVSLFWQFFGKWQRIRTSLVAFVLVVFSLLTWLQQSQYVDRETLWRETLQKNPECWLAYNNLGIEMENKGNDQEAVDYYRQAFHYNPGYAMAINNLVNQFIVRRENLEEAEVLLQKALRLGEEEYRLVSRYSVDYAGSHRLKGDLLRVQGRYDEAIERYRYTLKLNPDDGPAHIQLANLLQMRKEYDQALQHYQKALFLNPQSVETLNNIGVIYQLTGKLDQAIGMYYRVLELEPSYTMTHYNLATTLSKQGNFAKAMHHYQQVIRFEAQSPMAQKAQEKIRDLQKTTN